MLNTIILSLTSFLAFAPVSGHMMVQSPPVRDSKFNAKVLSSNINYNLMAPVQKPGCSQYNPTAPVATYNAGESVPFSFAGTASHNGGSCQFGLSYDGENFITLLDVIGNCLTGANSYDVPIPKDAPNGKAVLGWFWINKTGNREFYLNCVDVQIENGSDNGQISGRSISVANLNGFPTIPEGESGVSLTKDLYNNAKTITISKNGAPSYDTTPITPLQAKVGLSVQDQSKAEINIQHQSEPKSEPKPEPQPEAKSQPQPQAVEQPKQNDQAACESGVIGCNGETHITFCANGQLFKQACANGTKCNPKDKNVAFCT